MAKYRGFLPPRTDLPVAVPGELDTPVPNEEHGEFVPIVIAAAVAVAGVALAARYLRRS